MVEFLVVDRPVEYHIFGLMQLCRHFKNISGKQVQIAKATPYDLEDTFICVEEGGTVTSKLKGNIGPIISIAEVDCTGCKAYHSNGVKAILPAENIIQECHEPPEDLILP